MSSPLGARRPDGREPDAFAAVALAGYLLSLCGALASRDTAWAGDRWPSVLTALGIVLLPVMGVISATATFRVRGTRAVASARS